MKARQVLIVLGIIILLFILMIFYKIGYSKGSNFGANNPDKVLKKDSSNNEVVDTAIVKYVNVQTFRVDSVPLTINGYGRVNSMSKVAISSEVQGKLIANIPLKKGTHFSKGQTLFSLIKTSFKVPTGTEQPVSSKVPEQTEKEVSSTSKTEESAPKRKLSATSKAKISENMLQMKNALAQIKTQLKIS